MTGSIVHAYLHRKEGDMRNAGGWYSRAGREPATVSLEEAWQSLADEMLTVQAIVAERTGCDAFVIGHFQEPRLTECRCGRHPGHRPRRGHHAVRLLDRSPDRAGDNRSGVHSLARGAGNTPRVVAACRWRGGHQGGSAAVHERVHGTRGICCGARRFVQQVRPLLERGCDVLIPAGGLPMLLLAREQPFLIDGAVVLEGIATVMKATEMATSLSPDGRRGESVRVLLPRIGGRHRGFPGGTFRGFGVIQAPSIR
jgi:allantoin racemase